MKEGPRAVVCTACKAETFLKRTPKYDGFTKVGEVLTCVSCGHEFDDETEMEQREQRPAVFTEDERPRAVAVFRDEEKGRLCRYCRHYVVNPFTQRCGSHNRIVEATDSCDDFEAKEE